MDSHVGHSRSNLYSMLQQHQAEISAQLETFLVSVCTGSLPVADRLELRRLADALCYASSVTDKPLPNTSGVDEAVAALFDDPNSVFDGEGNYLGKRDEMSASGEMSDC